MAGAFLGGAITGGLNTMNQTSQLCSQYASIGNNTRGLNTAMQTALASYQEIDAELNQQIITLQLAIADDTQKLQQLQFHYVSANKIMQIFLGITLLTAALLLIFKHYNFLDWKQYLYIIFAMFTIGILSSVLYSYGFAPLCQSSITPTQPQYVLVQNPNCECTTTSVCPFGCDTSPTATPSGCWSGQLTFAATGASALDLRIVDVNANPVKNVVLPSFATIYQLSSIQGYSYAPLQASLRIVDADGCAGPYLTTWWINVDGYKSSSVATFVSPSTNAVLTATVDAQGNGTISIAPASNPSGSASQQWTLWVDQSVNAGGGLFVLQNQNSKLIAQLTAPYSSELVPLSYENGNLCSPQGCGPCPGGLANHQWTQAFGLYPVTDVVGGVAVYYARNDGNYGILNTTTAVFDNSAVSTSAALTDEDIQTQWRFSYTTQ